MTLREGGYRTMGRLSKVYTRRSRGGDRLRILAYHEVPDSGLFYQQMTWVRSVLVPMPLEYAVDGLRRRLLPTGAVVVTFDDGDPTIVDNALPILDRLEIQATAFVCPGLIDTTEPSWWQVVDRAVELGISQAAGRIWTVAELKVIDDSVRRDVVAEIRRQVEERIGDWTGHRQLTTSELERWRVSGHSIGNHTWDHPVLDRCAPSFQIDQIVKAHNWLMERFGESKFFAYPNGNISDTAKAQLKDLKYHSALLFDHAISTPGDPLTLSRIRVNASDSLSEFQAKASGLHPTLANFRRWFQQSRREHG